MGSTETSTLLQKPAPEIFRLNYFEGEAQTSLSETSSRLPRPSSPGKSRATARCSEAGVPNNTKMAKRRDPIIGSTCEEIFGALSGPPNDGRNGSDGGALQVAAAAGGQGTGTGASI